jgi:hypothetical protein
VLLLAQVVTFLPYLKRALLDLELKLAEACRIAGVEVQRGAVLEVPELDADRHSPAIGEPVLPWVPADGALLGHLSLPALAGLYGKPGHQRLQALEVYLDFRERGYVKKLFFGA